MDKVILSGIELEAHGGVAAAEREMGHRLIVDVELLLDISRAGSTDNLDDAVDFSAVYRLVRQTVEEREFKLLESVTERIAACLLESFPVHAVCLRVVKPLPPVGGIAAYEAVHIQRERGAKAPA